MTDSVRRIARQPLPGDHTPDLDPLQQEIRRYLDTRTLREKAQGEENGLKGSLMETLAESGREEGEHRVITLEEPWPLTTYDKSGNPKPSIVKGIMRQKKTSQIFDATAAMALIKEKGLEDECLQTITETVLDEDALLAANYAGKVTDAEVEALYSNKDSYSFVPIKQD